MLLFLGAVVAGVLTTLAPCVLPMLPVIVGGSLGPSSAQARRRAYVITASLGLSIVALHADPQGDHGAHRHPERCVAVDQRRHPDRPGPGVALPRDLGPHLGRAAAAGAVDDAAGVGPQAAGHGRRGPHRGGARPGVLVLLADVRVRDRHGAAGVARAGDAAAARLRRRPVRDAARDRTAGPEVHRQRPLGRRPALVVPSRTRHRVHPGRHRDRRSGSTRTSRPG